MARALSITCGLILCAVSVVGVAQESLPPESIPNAEEQSIAPVDCPVALVEAASISDTKKAFACRQFEDVVLALRDWNSVDDPKERFDRLSLYIAALANTGKYAETLVTVRYALRFVRLEPEQMAKLTQMVQVVANAVPKATEDEIFLEVLMDPENTELNFRLALAQTANGNTKGLSGTLSRILLYEEDNYLAKDMLSQLNIARGNLAEAESDLRRIVADPSIPEQEKAQATQLLLQLEDIRSPHTLTKIAGYTWGRADNPLSISETGNSLVAAFPGVLFDAGTEVTEYYEQSLLGLNYQYSLPYQSPQAITAGLTIINKDFQTQAALRMRIALLSLGYNWIATGDSISFTVTDIDLARDSLSKSYKIGGVKTFLRTQKASLSGSLDVTNNAFQSSTTQDKNGNAYGLGLKGSYAALGGRMIFLPNLSYVLTDAKTDPDSTDVFSYSLGTSVPMNAQWTGSLTLKQTETDRDGPDTTVDDLTRVDDAFNWTVAFNWRNVGPPNKKVPTIGITYTETKTDSNIINFDTITRDANLALTWVF